MQKGHVIILCAR